MTDMSAAGPLVAAGGLVVGGIQSAKAGASAYEAQAERERAYEQWLALNVPDINEQKLALQRYQQVGVLDPKFEQAVKRGDTNFSNITEDPRLREAQMSALDSLQNISERGGRTIDMEANLNKVRGDVNAADRGRRGAIQQQLAARGGGNISGLEMAGKLSSTGDAANRESQAALEASRNAEQNALASLEKAGTAAGNVRGQDYGIQKNLAEAKDSVDQFNASMLAGTNQRNTATANAAMGTNLSEKQRIADQNAGLSNYEQEKNKGLLQQRYENELQKTSGASNAINAAANGLTGLAKNQSDAANNWLQGGVKAGATAWDNYLKSDKAETPAKADESSSDEEDGEW